MAFSEGHSGSHFDDSAHSVFAFFQFCYSHVRGADGHLDWGSVGLVLGQLVNVDDPLLSEDLDDFAFVSFVSASQDHDLVVFSDGQWSDAVLFSKVFR